MIYFTRAVKTVPGKQKEAVEWGLRLTAYYNEHYPGHNAQILTNIGGSVHQIYWVASFDSLADFESTGKKAGSDPEWQALHAEENTVVEVGSKEDSFFRVA